MLFDKKKTTCMIQACKPYNCSAAPFISLLFQDKQAIDVFKDKCRGFGQGKFYSKANIVAQLRKEIQYEVEDWGNNKPRMLG